MQIRRTYGLVATALLAVACTPTLVNFAPRVHVVQPGDTLFSIAWRYQLDVRQLVLWNDLENPDLILVGQQLFLTPPGSSGSHTVNNGRTPAAPPASSGPTGSAQAGAPQRGTTPPSVTPPPESQPAAPTGSGGAGSSTTPAPTRQAAVPPAPTPVPSPPPAAPARTTTGSMGAASASAGQSTASRPPPPPPAPPPSLAVLPAPTWQWPIRGAVVSPYGAAQGTGSGIGIGGRLGADIRASAAGQVVYAGDGLAAYGNLVIIKHNDTFLSAYGHNEELMVGEGDPVRQGDVIARMGMGPERRPQVHFEIRRNGTPVDPLGYLPN
ncbi:MAG: peptidoglycan DD-metalloendopeptidase family protein [Rhodospirillaceae bacterium]|nr:peptidoglycan DD-metalloendopeptidase family protein [Rhodospirillaceae bacterium]